MLNLALPVAPVSYRVLARKYRPLSFQDMIGQDTVVRLLTNAFDKNRLGHGFLFTGIRGVGKTTTARLLALALNCSNLQKRDGRIEPCGSCTSCAAFLDDRHMDIIEMDAASHTGVDDIRSILESCRYRPVLGAYKVFIIDEVHMLSKSAFNALLKTLEEPPAHVKFIFATTEVQKVPVTVVSRCLRFNLSRVPASAVVPYLQKICEREGTLVEENALLLLARAGEGSVRDTLSLLDQALVLNAGSGGVRLGDVQHMLGLGNMGLIQDILRAVFETDAKAALEASDAMMVGGGDPHMILDAMASLVHQLMCLKMDVTSVLIGLNEDEVGFLNLWAAKIDIPTLGRLWQMILKGAEETSRAPFPAQALSMVLVRLAYVAGLPSPETWIAPPTHAPADLSPKLQASSAPKAPPPSPPPSRPAPQATGSQPSHPEGAPACASLQDVLDLLEARREGLLKAHLLQDAEVLSFQEGRIHLALAPESPTDLPKQLQRFLVSVTKKPWTVSVSQERPQKTLADTQKENESALQQEALATPLIKKVVSAFPGLVIDKTTPTTE